MQLGFSPRAQWAGVGQSHVISGHVRRVQFPFMNPCICLSGGKSSQTLPRVRVLDYGLVPTLRTVNFFCFTLCDLLCSALIKELATVTLSQLRVSRTVCFGSLALSYWAQT